MKKSDYGALTYLSLVNTERNIFAYEQLKHQVVNTYQISI